jgi:predicted MFS family arabinose efflux permease
MIGLAVGFVWTSLLPLSLFLLFCALAAGVSAALSYYLVDEPVITLESSQLVFHPLSYASRVYHGITTVFQHLVIDPPSPKDVLKTLRAIRAGSMTGRALLFLSTFFFTTASGLLNTAFTPFLVSAGVTDNEVFALSLVNVLVQTLAYRVVGRIVGRFGGVRIGSYALVGRTALYMGFAGVALVFVGFDLFVITTTLFALVGVAYALWNSSTSVVLFSSLGEKTKQGNILGGYAALTALGSVAGSLVTGYISFYQGYSTTFSIAAALMLVSFFILEASLKSLGYIGNGNNPGRPAP